MAEGHAWQGVCVLGDAWQGEHAWQGACMAGGVHGRGACVAGGCMTGVCVAGGMHGRGHAWQGGVACMPPDTTRYSQ